MYRSYIKLLFDKVVAILVIVAIWPFLAMIAIVVRIYLGPPVFFWQDRAGFHGKLFMLCKYRTMTNKRDANGQFLPDAERLTKLGRFLRATSLDELPGLVNVLRGEMSLVGPRPLLMQYLERYTPEQMRRHDVRPGITGWAQVHGRNALSWEEKFKLDVWYVDHVSFWLDMKIILLTIWKVLKREGISQPGQATMEEFFGSDS